MLLIDDFINIEGTIEEPIDKKIVFFFDWLVIEGLLFKVSIAEDYFYNMYKNPKRTLGVVGDSSNYI